MLRNKIGFIGVAALLCAALCADTVINGNRTILGAWDASSATSVKPVRVGTALPPGCSVGEVYFKKDAPANRALYVCSSAGAWTQIAYAHGTAAQLPVACDAGQIYFATDTAQGQNLYFCNPANSWNQMSAGAGALLSANNVFSGSNTFSGRLDASASVETLPAQVGAALPANCTTGAVFLKTGGAANRMLYYCSAANTWTQSAYASGASSARPAACDAGQIYFATDAAAGQNLHFCNPANSWNQMSAGGTSLPAQAGNAGKLLTTDGSTASWRSWDWGDQPGGWTSTYHLMDAVAVNGNQSITSTTVAVAVMLRFPRMTFNRAVFSVGTACTSCAFRFALYAADRATRVWDSGAITDTSTPGLGSVGMKTISSSNVTLDEGWYWFVWAANNTTFKFYACENIYGFPNLMNATAGLTTLFAGRAATGPTGSGATFDLPASLGTIVNWDDTAKVPYVYFVRQ